MAKPKRIPKSTDDLKRELVDQLAVLRHACESYDQGFEAIAKHMALSLRVLLHLHGRSRALLDQLGLLSGVFVDTAGPINPQNLLSSMPLLGGRATFGPNGQVRYVPKICLGGGGPPIPPRQRAFINWWNDPVIVDAQRNTFSRKELVINVADTDGGAHVDPALDESYEALSRRNSLGWSFSSGGQDLPLKGRPELACIRQIAHELLLTLSQFAPEFSAHAQPVIPLQARS
jgi:hypothetical protein